MILYVNYKIRKKKFTLFKKMRNYEYDFFLEKNG